MRGFSRKTRGLCPFIPRTVRFELSVIYGAYIDNRLTMRHYWRMNLMPPILQDIKTARLAKGLTQEEFARAAGIPRRTYQRLESGDPGTRVDTLFRALHALGLTLKTAPRGRPTLNELSELYGNDA
jgi:HTH-type transcriptional regulator/antitoxin HipB